METSGAKASILSEKNGTILPKIIAFNKSGWDIRESISIGR